jgi:hypothetical protein
LDQKKSLLQLATEFTVFFNSFLKTKNGEKLADNFLCWWKEQFVNISVIKCVEKLNLKLFCFSLGWSFRGWKGEALPSSGGVKNEALGEWIRESFQLLIIVVILQVVEFMAWKVKVHRKLDYKFVHVQADCDQVRQRIWR